GPPRLQDRDRLPVDAARVEQEGRARRPGHLLNLRRIDQGGYLVLAEGARRPPPLTAAHVLEGAAADVRQVEAELQLARHVRTLRLVVPHVAVPAVEVVEARPRLP